MIVNISQQLNIGIHPLGQIGQIQSQKYYNTKIKNNELKQRIQYPGF